MNTNTIIEIIGEAVDQIAADEYRTFDGIIIKSLNNGVSYEVQNNPVRHAPQHLRQAVAINRDWNKGIVR